jgi:kanamycin kinase
MTVAVPGESAVSDRWRLDPRRAVSAIGEGLRALHEALPVDLCPFSWSTDFRLGEVRRRVRLGRLDPRGWDADHRGLTVEGALELLAEIPTVDREVVCHGDACAPNTLISDGGRCSGHVDFGAMGVGDRWADLAVATWSTQWNYGPGWEEELLAAYGVPADTDRIRYYRLLWDLGP